MAAAMCPHAAALPSLGVRLEAILAAFWKRLAARAQQAEAYRPTGGSPKTLPTKPTCGSNNPPAKRIQQRRLHWQIPRWTHKPKRMTLTKLGYRRDRCPGQPRPQAEGTLGKPHLAQRRKPALLRRP
ncbi:Hypothetical predicted protein, partial [Pelobates cultripes]